MGKKNLDQRLQEIEDKRAKGEITAAEQRELNAIAVENATPPQLPPNTSG